MAVYYKPYITKDGEWFGNKGIFYKTCKWTGCGDECFEGTEVKIGEDFFGDSNGAGCSFGNVKSRCCIANKYSTCPQECYSCWNGKHNARGCNRWCSRAGYCGDADDSNYNAKSRGVDCTKCPTFYGCPDNLTECCNAAQYAAKNEENKKDAANVCKITNKFHGRCKKLCDSLNDE